MNLKDLFSIAEFKYIQGIEGKLRRRRRNGLLASVTTILLGLFAVIREVSLSNEFFLGYLTRVFQHTLFAIQYFLSHFWSIIALRWDSLPAYRIIYDVVGAYIILLGLVIYLLNRHTAFLFSMSDKPFQYTFWIDRFQRAKERDENSATTAADDLIHQLLHHDLMDMLNRRIGRFSLLDEKYLRADADPDSTPPSHIHIDGHYAIRDMVFDGRTATVIQIMPRVRIGPPGNPSILTLSVEVELDSQPPARPRAGGAKDGTETAEKTADAVGNPLFAHEVYKQVLEQVYSRVASEIYKQIKFDIKQKIHLFPTHYLRAVALYHEAEDFSRSNTIDSYDYAIELYQEALRYYDISIRYVLSSWLLRLRPLRLGIGYEATYASTKIGYAKCLIYRRAVSSLTGRTKNPLYEVPDELDQVVRRLIRLHNKFHIGRWRVKPVGGGTREKADLERIGIENRLNLTLSSLLFQKDTWQNRIIRRKPDTASFKKLRELLFDAYVVLALVYANLEAVKKAEENLENAKATYPEKCGSHALFLLAKAEAQLDLALKIPLLIQSTEVAPDFEIAQYLLAKYMLQLFLSRGELERERAKPVIREFNNVLKINPGNIASFAHLGYLYWLLDDLARAQKQFEQGIKTKTIVQQTFIGELNYGLARIAARRGEFNRCYTLYSESLAAEPGLGAYSIESFSGKTRVTSFYDYITPSVLAQYRSFKQNFEIQIQTALARIYAPDIVDLHGLRKAVERDQYRIFQPLKRKATQSVSADGAEQPQSNSCSAAELALQLNALLADAQLCERVLSQDKSLAEQIQRCAADKISLARCNRLVLERLYPQYIQPSGADEYFEQFTCPRQLFEDGQKLISPTTLNQSYSYVLNDYGNACLNYYHRFGDKKQLVEAMTAFAQAIKLHPNNGIAYYNMANAILWHDRSYEGFRETKRYLEKANETMQTLWPKVIIEAVRYQMLDLRHHIEQAEEDIKYYEGELTALKEKIEELEKRKQPAQLVEKATEAKDFSQEAAKPLEQLEKELEDVKNERQKIEERLAEQRSSLKKLQREFRNKFTSAIRKTIELSNFTAMLEGFGIDPAGSSIDQLISVNIIPDRLDERDIEALKGWADLLSSINQTDEQAIEAAVKLCDFIAKYTPRSFDIDYISFNARVRLDDLQTERVLRETPVSQLIAPDELAKMWGQGDAQELAAQSPAAIFQDRGALNQIKTRLRSPFCKPGDIRQPQALLAKLIAARANLAIEEAELASLTALQSQRNKEEIRRDLIAALVRTLNRLMQNHLYKEGPMPSTQFSQRTQELMEFDLAGRLKGDDLVRLNRRLLEELFPAEIAISQIELYRERICETIQDWLVSDPTHFLALDEWARNFLLFPEYELALKKAIQYRTPNVHEFHRMLAELYEKPDYAVDAMRNLEKAIEEYPEQGIYHLKLSQVLRQKNRFADARDKLKEAEGKKVIGEDDYNGELKSILAAEATYLISQADWQSVVSKYKEALRHFPEDSGFKLNLAWAEKEHQKQRIAQHYGQKWVDQIMMVAPITVEVSLGLIPLIEGEAGEDSGLKESIQRLIWQMRERLRRKFGVKVPGIQFRVNEDQSSEGIYIIMLHEALVVRGTVPLGRRLFTGTGAELEALGIQANKTTDPLTGREAYWISEGEAAKLKAPPAPLGDAASYLIRHLEAVLQQHLVGFLGHQEVYDLICEHTPDKRGHYDNNKSELTRLTAVLRGLLSERVPLTAFPAIQAYVEQHQAEPNVTELINGVRLLPQVRQALPGNRNVARYLRLSAELEAAMQKAIRAKNGHYVLALPPETCYEMVSAMREKISGIDNAAIIVTNQRLRSLASRLLKFDFPNLPVIAQDELEEDDPKNVAEIAFAPAG